MRIGVLPSLCVLCIQADLDSDQQSLLQTKSRRDAKINVESKGPQPLENVPYIIRQYSTSEDRKWYGASMSYTTTPDGDYGHDHPMAAIFQDTEYLWYFRKAKRGWTIKAYSGSKKDYGLSWDVPQKDGKDWSSCHYTKDWYCYPMVSLEEGDECPWELEWKNDNMYIIKNAWSGPGTWYDQFGGFALSWDGNNGNNPRVSLQNRAYESLDWEIVPALSFKGYWQMLEPLTASSGASVTKIIAQGVAQSTELSKSNTFSETVGVSMSMGVEFPFYSVSGEITSEVTVEETKSVTNAVESSTSSEVQRTYQVSELANTMWEFVAEIKRNHYKYKSNGVWTSSSKDDYGKTIVKTPLVELTPSRFTDPKCLPGACQVDTGCQRCHSRDGCISAKQCDIGPIPCKDDTSQRCPEYKSKGLCDKIDPVTIRLMHEQCDTTCNCPQ